MNNGQLLRGDGVSEVDNLFNSGIPAAVATGVIVRAGQGGLSRGTVLALSDDDELMVVLGISAGSGETLTPNCVLAENVDASGVADVPAIAYRAGHFNRQALVCAPGYTLSRGDEEELRRGGIFLSDALA